MRNARKIWRSVGTRHPAVTRHIPLMTRNYRAGGLSGNNSCSIRGFSSAAAAAATQTAEPSSADVSKLLSNIEPGVLLATDTFFKDNAELIEDLSEFLLRNGRDRWGFSNTARTAVWDSTVSKRNHIRVFVPPDGDLSAPLPLIDDDSAFFAHQIAEDRRFGEYLGGYLMDEEACLDYSPLTLYLCLCHLRQLSESTDQVIALQTLDSVWRQYALHESGWTGSHGLEGILLLDEKNAELGENTKTARTGRGKNFILKLFKECSDFGHKKFECWKTGFIETETMSTVWKKHMQDRVGMGKLTQLQSRMQVLWHEDFNRTDYKSSYMTDGAKFETRVAQSCLEVGKAMGLNQEDLGLKMQDQFEEKIFSQEEKMAAERKERLYKGLDELDLKYGAINPLTLPEPLKDAQDAISNMVGFDGPAPPLDTDAQRLMVAQVASSIILTEIMTRSGEIIHCEEMGEFAYEWTKRAVENDENEVDVVAQVAQNLVDSGIKFIASSAYNRTDVMADALTAVIADASHVVEFKETITPHGNNFHYSDSPLIAKKMEQFKKEYRYA